MISQTNYFLLKYKSAPPVDAITITPTVPTIKNISFSILLAVIWVGSVCSSCVGFGDGAGVLVGVCSIVGGLVGLGGVVLWVGLCVGGRICGEVGVSGGKRLSSYCL